MNEYTDHAVVDLDEAGSIIANKNIKIDYLNQKLAAAEARIEQLEAENEKLSLYKNLADEYGLSVFADLAELEKQRDELLAALKLAKAGFSQAASGHISQKYLEEHFEAADAAIASVKDVREITHISTDMVERECCGTFFRTPHRSTCHKFRGKKGATP